MIKRQITVDKNNYEEIVEELASVLQKLGICLEIDEPATYDDELGLIIYKKPEKYNKVLITYLNMHLFYHLPEDEQEIIDVGLVGAGCPKRKHHLTLIECNENTGETKYAFGPETTLDFIEKEIKRVNDIFEMRLIESWEVKITEDEV